MSPDSRYSIRSTLQKIRSTLTGGSRLDVYSRLLALAWTTLIVVLLGWSFVRANQVTQELALKEAYAILNKDHSFRRWAVNHGGVYVQGRAGDALTYPIDGLPQEVILPDGTVLTLLFPGQIQREINAEFSDRYGISGRLTSLEPLNPQNSPDEWERASLLAIQDGAQEVAEFTRIGDAPYLRLAQPLVAQQNCLGCHADAQVGKILGAENIAMPMTDYLAHQQEHQQVDLISHSILWVLGLVGIGLGHHQLNHEANELVRAGEALQESEARYRDLLENANDLVQSVGANGRFLYVNRRWGELTGYTPEEALQMYFWQILRPDQVSHCMKVFQQLQTNPQPQRIEAVFLTKEGKELVLEGNINAQYNGSALQATRGIFRDVTERKFYEANLEFLATHDPLTGLPNRTLVSDYMIQALERARRSGESLAVLFMDLDGFKRVNDECGHKEGDDLLRLLGKRLSSGLRSSDTVARFGGDEFLILVENLRNPADASRVAEKVLNNLASPFELEGRQVSLTASIGVSLFPQDGTDIATLIRHADAAMYAVKDHGRNSFLFYSALAGQD